MLISRKSFGQQISKADVRGTKAKSACAPSVNQHVSITSKKPLSIRPTVAVKPKPSPKKSDRTGAIKVSTLNGCECPVHPLNNKQIALNLLTQSKDPSKSGSIIIRWNHYRKQFPVHNGVVKFQDIDNEYCFSFVYRGDYKRMLILDDGGAGSGSLGETSAHLRSDDEMLYYLDVDPRLSYLIRIEEDPEAGIGAEGLRVRDGPLTASSPDKSPSNANASGNRQVSLITNELLGLKVADLHSASAKALREARDVEDILFSGPIL